MGKGNESPEVLNSVRVERGSGLVPEVNYANVRTVPGAVTVGGTVIYRNQTIL